MQTPGNKDRLRAVALAQYGMLSMMAMVLYVVMATPGNAGGAGGVFCTAIATTMGSGLANAIATIGVLIVGVGATLGRMSWTMAITVAVGIATVFTTASWVAALSGGLGVGCFGA